MVTSYRLALLEMPFRRWRSSTKQALVVVGLANAEDSEPGKPGSVTYRVLRIAHVAVAARAAGDLRQPFWLQVRLSTL
jgi:hypothetical protein